ncbi:MAG: hypothetical protein EXS68_03240 [Candidatus Ryanbacteria bacterium]|nr:hypothetical protein [Candidatus Ryanbacteria bacterium]
METEVWKRIYRKTLKVTFSWLALVVGILVSFYFLVEASSTSGIRWHDVQQLVVLLLFIFVMPISVIVFPVKKIHQYVGAYLARENDISKRRRYNAFQHFLVLPFYSLLLFIPVIFILFFIFGYLWSDEGEGLLAVFAIPVYGLGTLLIHLFFVAVISYGLWRDEISGGEKSPDVYKKRRRIFLALFLGALILLIVVIPTLVYLLTPRY